MVIKNKVLLKKMDIKLISKIKVPTKYLDPRDRQSMGYKKKIFAQ